VLHASAAKDLSVTRRYLDLDKALGSLDRSIEAAKVEGLELRYIDLKTVGKVSTIGEKDEILFPESRVSVVAPASENGAFRALNEAFADEKISDFDAKILSKTGRGKVTVFSIRLEPRSA